MEEEIKVGDRIFVKENFKEGIYKYYRYEQGTVQATIIETKVTNDGKKLQTETHEHVTVLWDILGKDYGFGGGYCYEENRSTTIPMEKVFKIKKAAPIEKPRGKSYAKKVGNKRVGRGK